MGFWEGYGGGESHEEPDDRGFESGLDDDDKQMLLDVEQNIANLERNISTKQEVSYYR